MADHGQARSTDHDRALELLTDLSPVFQSIGKPEFYSCFSKAIAQFLDSRRYLTVRYAQYAKPNFLVNEAMSLDAVESYLRNYYRIDPLLRMVREEATRPVVTFEELRKSGPDTLFYDEMYRTAGIRDELVFLFPTVGGVFAAICVDRSRRLFSEAEILRSKLIYPTLREIHALHVHQSLSGHIRGNFDDDGIATLILDAKDKILFRNSNWSSEVDPSAERKLCERVSLAPRGSERVENGQVLHWESLDAHSAIAPGGKAAVLERASPGYLDLLSSDLVGSFLDEHKLTPREIEIVTHILKGETTTRISAALGISIGTIRNHKHNLYYKLDITTERELFCMIFEAMTRQSAA